MSGHVLALCGGVGGAKLAHGLAQRLAPDDLSIIVNSGDDFEHLGLHVSPDIDTVVYTLSGLADAQRGWGVAGETWNFMSSLRGLGGEAWFQLGDRDLAMHVERTRRLRSETLSEVTAGLATAIGVRHAIVPMSDQPVRTWISTEEGELEFQRYFVERQCRPVAAAIRFAGAERTAPSEHLSAVLARQDITAIVICPSNPYLSIDPILAVPGVRAALEKLAAPVVAVSPIIAGAALKGPAAKLMSELGHGAGVVPIADHYQGLLAGLVIDRQDADAVDALRQRGVEVLMTDAVMRDEADRGRLADEVLAFANQLRQVSG